MITRLPILLLLCLCLVSPHSYAAQPDYHLMSFELVETTRNKVLDDAIAAKEAAAKAHKKLPEIPQPAVDNNPDPKSFSVTENLYILSGKFKIEEIPTARMVNKRAIIRQYQDNLTQINDNSWKIALQDKDINPDKNQEIVQEILRQLNAKEEAAHSVYKEINLHGWTIRIQEDLLADPIKQRRALRELGQQLSKIRNRVPFQAVQQLQRVPIWLYKNKPGINTNVLAYYTPLYKAVIFHNARKLYQLSDVQNAVVLHELSHGYHNIVLGDDRIEIIEAYENALAEGLYRNVKTQGGTNADSAYALTNYKEYFAELTEAYFSNKIGSFENDYYPFNRSDLQKYDKTGYQMVKKMWNGK